jgi:hypothetical protein
VLALKIPRFSPCHLILYVSTSTMESHYEASERTVDQLESEDALSPIVMYMSDM